MINTIINALVAGILGGFAIVIMQSIIAGQDTSGWNSALGSIFGNIPIVIGIVVIVGMFMLLTKLRGEA